MKYYLIKNTLTHCSREDIGRGEAQFAAVLSTAEWKLTRDSFGMEIDIDSSITDRRETKAIVNLDSLTGSFSVPDRADISGQEHRFAFVLDERGIIIIDDEGYASSLIDEISRTKKWRLPSLERFIYDLLEAIISKDLNLLESIEKQLDLAEKEIVSGKIEDLPEELNDVRGDLLDLRLHYGQLIDLGQELEENENGYFREENLRYFHMFTERVARLQDMVMGQREYVSQLRDLMQTQLDVRQNRIMTVLTVITSIFLPLTLIAGWYGMNFRYMPELEWKYSYPVLIAVSVLIVVVCLVWFKKKKWM